MYSITISILFVALCRLGLAVPANGLMSRQAGSPYDCGCSAQKQAITNAGGDSFDLAVSMLETGSALSGTSYTYGDGKSGDSANFGAFKNNWYAIRTACSQFAGLGADDFNQGATLNDDIAGAVKCQHEQLSHFAGDAWYGVQRDGETGAADPSTSDIQSYKTGVQYIKSYLDQGHVSDDQATSYSVPPI